MIHCLYRGSCRKKSSRQSDFIFALDAIRQPPRMHFRPGRPRTDPSFPFLHRVFLEELPNQIVSRDGQCRFIHRGSLAGHVSSPAPCMPAAFDHHRNHFGPVPCPPRIGFCGSHRHLITTFRQQVNIRILVAPVRFHPRSDRLVDGPELRARICSCLPAAEERECTHPTCREKCSTDTGRFNWLISVPHQPGYRSDGGDAIRTVPRQADRPAPFGTPVA